MSTKKTETSAAVEEKKSKTDIETRMEAGKVEVMKVVGGIPGAEKLAELIERGKKKGNLSAAELMDVLEDMDLESDQMDKINTDIVTKYDDTIGNLMLNNVDLYLNGQLDKDAAIAQFKDDVASNYRRLDVE